MSKLVSGYMLFTMFLWAPYMMMTKDGVAQSMWLIPVALCLIWLHLVETGMREDKELFYLKKLFREFESL